MLNTKERYKVAEMRVLGMVHSLQVSSLETEVSQLFGREAAPPGQQPQ